MSISTNDRLSCSAVGQAEGREKDSVPSDRETPRAESSKDSMRSVQASPFLRVVDASMLCIFYSVRFLSRVLPPVVLVRFFNALGSTLYLAFPGIGRRLVEKVTEAMPDLSGQKEAGRIAHFALQTGAPIVPFALLRGTRPLETRLVFYEPIVAQPEGDNREDVRSTMMMVAAEGEKMIREAPEQWESWFGIRYFWGKAAELSGSTFTP